MSPFHESNVFVAGGTSILNPEHIAEDYWSLHTQPRDAWTFEMDLRPYLHRNLVRNR